MSMKKAVWVLVWLCISAGMFIAGTASAQATSARVVSAEADSVRGLTDHPITDQKAIDPEVSGQEASGLEINDWHFTDGRVPAAVIALPHNRYAVLVEKQTQRLYVYRSGPDARNPVQVFEAACSTGEMPGPKQVEGDKKTPEGIYFILEVFEEKYLTPVYGSRALTMDYPNFFDLSQNKTGYAIWIHGTDKVLKPMDTNGCVALENSDVVALSRYITPHVTPVIIQERILTIAPEDLEEKRHTVSTFVAEWVQAQLTGTFNEYQAFYAPSAQPGGRGWQNWDALRRSWDSGLEPLGIQISDLGIFAHKDTLVVVMAFVLVMGDEVRDLGSRKLYIQQDETGRLQIADDRFEVPGNPSKRSLAVLEEGGRSLRRSGDSQTALPHE
jgi:lipoprotein-anchoring transpeptidase ErfK/SrfK